MINLSMAKDVREILEHREIRFINMHHVSR